jgi:hypothetical protein
MCHIKTPKSFDVELHLIVFKNNLGNFGVKDFIFGYPNSLIKNPNIFVVVLYFWLSCKKLRVKFTEISRNLGAYIMPVNSFKWKHYEEKLFY